MNMIINECTWFVTIYIYLECTWNIYIYKSQVILLSFIRFKHYDIEPIGFKLNRQLNPLNGSVHIYGLKR